MALMTNNPFQFANNGAETPFGLASRGRHDPRLSTVDIPIACVMDTSWMEERMSNRETDYPISGPDNLRINQGEMAVALRGVNGLSYEMALDQYLPKVLTCAGGTQVHTDVQFVGFVEKPPTDNFDRKITVTRAGTFTTFNTGRDRIMVGQRVYFTAPEVTRDRDQVRPAVYDVGCGPNKFYYALKGFDHHDFLSIIQTVIHLAAQPYTGGAVDTQPLDAFVNKHSFHVPGDPKCPLRRLAVLCKEIAKSVQDGTGLFRDIEPNRVFHSPRDSTTATYSLTPNMTEMHISRASIGNIRNIREPGRKQRRVTVSVQPTGPQSTNVLQGAVAFAVAKKSSGQTFQTLGVQDYMNIMQIQAMLMQEYHGMFEKRYVGLSVTDSHPGARLELIRAES